MKGKIALGFVGSVIALGAVNSVAETLTGEPVLTYGGQVAAAAPPNAAQAPSGVWNLPARGSMGTAYGVPGKLWASGHHTGIDFAVPTGTTIHAASAGQVVAAGWGGAYGNQVVIKHGELYTQYAHLSSITVKKGQTVDSGTSIGRSGSTGNSTGPHLHFEVRTKPGYGHDINPAEFLRKQGVSF